MPITSISDDDLFTRCHSAIWAAARGEAQGGDDASYNRATDLMRESTRRHVEAGHTDRCSGSVYNRAYEQAVAEHAFRAPELPGCNCGATQ